MTKSPHSIPKEVIVVEGRADTRRLKEVYGPHIKTLETNGSAMDPERIEAIAQADQKFGIIILTDPDYPGLRIRRLLTQQFPQAKQAHLSPELAQGQGKNRNLGVEYASDEAIRSALDSVLTPIDSDQLSTKISQGQLYALGLVGTPKAAERRQAVAQHFKLGHLNAKQLKQRLETYQLSLEEVQAFLEEEVD